ncbi:phytoene/squalene synthase family protein [Luteolibacter pohnpeiensis]|uniref:Phytoene/squalene synthase family protein n=1 Tax=Luteolibacter pohnpeiensis TaxID=454153 RepID=A0A934VX59_9BACT|nr:phytoene/squalene synthase family protein [Luteolibacter pohnpeiensis]MBK1883493.1 phytoene/squalene synthase family protein [Luteolibacter pohnpeiensis]
MRSASEITRKAKSNLALALKLLPKERRDDMVVFYAYCRTMDDLADEPDRPLAERAAALASWIDGVENQFTSPDDFQREVEELKLRHQIPGNLLGAIARGCKMDLEIQRFDNWEALEDYIWHVAGAVGLVSIRLFGCKNPESEAYALTLAKALQLTNILRDIHEDLNNGGRIYLPLQDLKQFDYGVEDLQSKLGDARFIELMEFEAARAEDYFDQADRLLPMEDFQELIAARVMGDIYRTLLKKMRDDGFRVFDKRYELSKARKLALLSKQLVARNHMIE